MAVSPALIKAAVTLATDKRIWTFVFSIILGIIFFIVAIIAAFLSLFSIDNTASTTASAAYVQYVNNMKYSYSKLDAAADATGISLDKEQIHAVFYTLYFGDNTALTDQFYTEFVECFVIRATDKNGSPVVYSCSFQTALSKLATVTGKSTSSITQQQINELCSVLRYSSQTAGNDGNTYSGPTPDAYSDATFAQLMNEAEKYIGCPYVWGGSSPSTSFDCSGFVCWSYTQSGVYNLPRTTAQGIYNQCALITRENAKPGDLVFFTRTYVTHEPVTHIGIYVGNGQMLHCGDPIAYASIDSNYWSSHMYGFGRLPIGS